MFVFRKTFQLQSRVMGTKLHHFKEHLHRSCVLGV